MKIETIMFGVLLAVVIICGILFLFFTWLGSAFLGLEMQKYKEALKPARGLPLLILSISGEVEYLPHGAERWQKLTLHDVIYQGAKIRTKEGAYVTIYLGKQLLLTAYENTFLEIIKSQILEEGNYDIYLKIPEGEIACTVREMPEGSSFAIQTPTTIYRSTQACFLLSVEKGKDRIFVIWGEVEAEYIDKTRRIIKPGIYQVAEVVEEKVIIKMETPPAEVEAKIAAHIKEARKKVVEAPREIDLTEEIKRLKKIIEYCTQKIIEREIDKIMPFLSDPFIFNDTEYYLQVIKEMLTSFVQKHQKIKIEYDIEKIVFTFSKDYSKVTATFEFNFHAEEISQKLGPGLEVIEEVVCIIKGIFDCKLIFMYTDGAWICYEIFIKQKEEEQK